MTIHWKAVEQYVTVVVFVFQFYPVCKLENLSILDMALSGVKGFTEFFFISLLVPTFAQ